MVVDTLQPAVTAAVAAAAVVMLKEVVVVTTAVAVPTMEAQAEEAEVRQQKTSTTLSRYSCVWEQCEPVRYVEFPNYFRFNCVS